MVKNLRNDHVVARYRMNPPLRYFSDAARHLVCWPFSVENLHRMAAELRIQRHWFHASKHHAHYDIPKRRLQEIAAKTEVVSGRVIVAITKGKRPNDKVR